jgi:hypothetical protein
VNPIDINQTGSAPTETHYTSSDSVGFAKTNAINGFLFRQASSFGSSFFQITNLALATTFAEAATNVFVTNAVAPKIVYQPVGLTNYLGNPVSLTAVANGQGLAAMTYQWYQDGNPYPGATTSILSLPNAQTSDTGDYTLVATTPFGLSVTSSIAHIFISAALDSPSFVKQPASLTAYRGQTVVFSTSVISPDINTIVYQWKSNNVDIAGATAATYTLNNVTTNFSGSIFSVGVTNDVNPVGIVSTNAVLTVLNPSSVSIAYLRTLVDPTAFTATPGIPYQVTGTVTTFTNITTGTTASYYLQDGTGGINIFETGNTSFRPAQGAVVTYVGVLSSFTSGLELYADPSGLYPYTSYVDTGATAPLPTPRIIPFTITNTFTFAYCATNLAGSAVALTNVFFGTNFGTTISTNANVSVIVTNGSGSKFTLNFFFLDLDTAGKVLPKSAPYVSGVLYGLHPNYSLAVTRFSDILTNPTPPTANADSYSVASNTVNTVFNPLANDLAIAPATALGLVSVFPTNGTASISGSTVLFSPTANFLGTATVGYTVADNLGSTNRGLITISVTNVPPPISIPVSATVSGQKIILSWSNPVFSLQFSTNVVGPYATIGGATSPFTNLMTTNAAGFYRLKY